MKLRRNIILIVTNLLLLFSLKAQTSQKSDDGFDSFFTIFKTTAIAKDYKKLATMTDFPFTYQNDQLTKNDFIKTFIFQEDYIALFKTRKRAVKASKSETISFFGKNIPFYFYSIDHKNGVEIWFCLINGKWKFKGIIYGE